MPTFRPYYNSYYFGTFTGKTEIPWNGLVEGESASGKVVLESQETENKGDILAAGNLLPVTRYHVFNEVQRVQHPVISGDRQTSRWRNLYQEWFGPVDGASAVGPSWGSLPTPDFNRLRTEAHASANSSALDVLTNLAELPESIAMARNFMSNMKSRVQRIRNLRKVRASRSFEEFVRIFSDAWLEYRYGWRPLVGAARDLYEAVNVLQQSKRYLPVSGHASREYTATGSPGVTWVTNAFGGYVDTGSCVSTLKARSFVTHLIGRESAALGIQPMVTAWELVPYSFVVDWFTGIGDSIQASFLPPGVIQTIAGSSTKLVKAYEARRTRSPLSYTLLWSDGLVKYQREEYRRWEDPTSPPPFALFSQADRMSLAQWADLVLLAEGLLRRSFGS